MNGIKYYCFIHDNKDIYIKHIGIYMIRTSIELHKSSQT